MTTVQHSRAPFISLSFVVALALAGCGDKASPPVASSGGGGAGAPASPAAAVEAIAATAAAVAPGTPAPLASNERLQGTIELDLGKGPVALRSMATSYPYDQHEDGQMSLRSHAAEISEHLQKELAERLADAGVQVVDTRISHLAYAPEIAHAMLQRQQANAVIAARTRIVAGAVGMVEMALEELQKNGVVQLDEERKAAMVSNLLVVLCGDRSTQPIVNAGTLY